MATGLEAHRVDRPVDLGHAQQLFDLIRGSPLETSMVSHPKERACSRRSGTRSPTITTDAPRI